MGINIDLIAILRKGLRKARPILTALAKVGNLGNRFRHAFASVISAPLASQPHLATTLVIFALFTPFKSCMMLVCYGKCFLLD